MTAKTPLSSILDREGRKFWMGVAILWVFFYHLIFFYPDRDIPHILRLFIQYPNKGYLGVDIFFFLSSFGLCHSFNNNSWKQFYRNRLLRIIPIYIFFCVPVIFFFKEWGTLSNGVMLLVKQVTGISCINNLSSGIEWYTPALMATYFLFPLVYRVVNASNKFVYELVVVFAFVMTTNFTRMFIESNLAPRIPIIIIGILTYKYLASKQYTKLIVAYSIFAIMSLGAPNNITSESLLVPIILFGLDYLPISRRIRDVISFIGKYSYEIYLAQVITTLYILGQGRCFLPGVMQIVEVIIYTIPLSAIFVLINNTITRLLKKI